MSAAVAIKEGRAHDRERGVIRDKLVIGCRCANPTNAGQVVATRAARPLCSYIIISSEAKKKKLT